MTRLDDGQIARMRLMSGGALYDYALRLAAEVVRLRATIERVRALHEEVSHPIIAFCDHCDHAWPCPTIRALGPAGADRHNCAQLRATIEAVAEALAGDGQAVLKVAAAQQVLIDADRQEQP